MKKYLEDYIKILENKDKIPEKELRFVETKIVWFQHERLIHLLVTLSYVLFTLIFMILSLVSYIFLIPFFIGIVFIIFYIRHYFFLEKGVQYLYKLYDKLSEK